MVPEQETESLGLLCLLHRHAEDKIVGNEGQITLLIWGGGGGGGTYLRCLPKKPSRFPLLQSMEFVVAISNTDWCIQIKKDTDDFVDIMKMLLLLKKVRCLWY